MTATIYLDSSAILKRPLPEAESIAFVQAIEAALADDGTLVTSLLTRVEVGRSLRKRDVDVVGGIDVGLRESLQSIAIAPITEVIAELARSIEPPLLRSLDAIHLATAVAVGADEVWTYDSRFGDAAKTAGLTVRAPA